MFKILYAAGRHPAAQSCLLHFLQAAQRYPDWQIKIAAFKNYLPPNQHIDYTLDCLLHLIDPSRFIKNNDNLALYFERIKDFGPHLIISNEEYFTSYYLAPLLRAPLWNCFSTPIHQAREQDIQYNFKFSKFSKKEEFKFDINAIINNAKYNFIWSHFGDTINPPALVSKFEWLRPYHIVGTPNKAAQHSLVAVLPHCQYKVITTLALYDDAVLFTPESWHKHSELIIKNINNRPEYICNLPNAQVLLADGNSQVLADAFYNKKYIVLLHNFGDTQYIINTGISQHIQTATVVSYRDRNLFRFINHPIYLQYNPNIKQLHQKITEKFS